MSILDSFVSYNFNAGVPYVSITNNGMTFNKAVVIKLGYPKYVVLLVDAEGKRVAVQACDDTTPNAVAFYKEKKSNVISVRWNGRDLLNTIQEITGWDLKQSGGLCVEGVSFMGEKTVFFVLLKDAILFFLFFFLCTFSACLLNHNILSSTSKNVILKR